jgi:uncharacterized membrane protein AbrB (regulator of aidB expression)
MTFLGVALGLGAVVAHLVGRALRQPTAYALLASAQLGVPVAAATIGAELGVLRTGEGAAIVVGALVTLAATIAGGSLAARTSRRPETP